MYEEFFGFREPPFRITPDPRFLYRNSCVEEAAAALAYGIERRKGFLSLVGEAGTGKTTLLRHVLDTLAGNVRTVLLLHPTVGFDEILDYILGELGIPVDGARKLVLLQRLNEFLLEHTRAGGNVALLIDEAQDLSPEVLEELRLLSNLETGTEKILQIVLAGQPELEAKLTDPGLRQLRQRIALHVRLRPLSADEVTAYIATRLEHAGATRRDVFAPEAIERIAAVSQGIPRIINVLCDACLVTAFATGSTQVSAAIVDEAWVDFGRLVSLEPVPAVASPSPPVEPTPPPKPAPVDAAPAPVAAAAPTPARAATAAPAAAPTRAASSPSPSPDRPAPPRRALELGRPAKHLPPLGERESGPVSPRRVTLWLAAAIVGVLLFHTWNMRGAAPPEHGVAVVPPEPTVDRQVAAKPATAGLAPAAGNLPSAPEARAVVHEFLLAYEARDVSRLMQLFAPEAVQNDRHGVDAIGDDYTRAFDRLVDVTYTIPSVEVASQDDRMALSGPFIISFRDKTGKTGERRGRAEWQIAHRDGKARIVGLRYAFTDSAS